MREAIAEAIAKELPEVRFVVERPKALAHGDYATNAALVGKVDPSELASKLKIPGVEKVEVVGKFINFFLSREALIPQAPEFQTPHKGKTILVEYTQPNPFKEFHIGHLMSNALGESVARLLEISGAQVLRANYQGDVGPHVAKAIWGKMQNKELSWGEAYVLGNNSYDAHKDEIDTINKKVYDRSDEEVNALYDQGRTESLERFEEIYKKLGTHFDFYFFESETGPRGLKLVEGHPEVFEKSDGAIVFRGEHTRVFVTSLGLPTYETKDLGLLQLKKEKAQVDESITVTASEQNDYFKVVFEAAKKLPEISDIAQKTRHLSHGMMRFAAGKMSSRTGNVVTGESLINDLTEGARGREDVAVGAVKYAVLKSGSSRDIVFDPEKSLSLEGDSGPYLQYAHTRAVSLLNEAQKAGIEPHTKDAGAEASELERLLLHFPDVVARAAKELEPHHVTTYLTEVASAFNRWYATNRVIGGERPNFGVYLVQSVAATLAEGLHLLGIPAPEEM